MSYLMSGMYALPLCVPINRAYKGVTFGFEMPHGCMKHFFFCVFWMFSVTLSSEQFDIEKVDKIISPQGQPSSF